RARSAMNFGEGAASAAPSRVPDRERTRGPSEHVGEVALVFVHLRWIRHVATVHVLAVVTVCGCRGVAPDGCASAAGQQRPDRPEGVDWSRLDSHDPRPDHPVYDELEPGVREALLRLNTCNKLDAHLHENPHI